MSSPSRKIDEVLGAEVGGHDDEHVAEIDRAPLTVGEPSVVEHLQQDVEHVRMRFLDLVEQHDLIGPAPHRLGQRSAFLVADIAGRRADEPGDRVLLHVLGHVDAHHRALVVEQEGRERLGELRLADAGRPQEHERADRPVRVLQAGAGAPDGGRNGMHRFVLADDPAHDLLLHLEEFFALAFEHLVDRDAGPARDDLRDVVRGHRLIDEHAVALALRLLELLLKRRGSCRK